MSLKNLKKKSKTSSKSSEKEVKKSKLKSKDSGKSSKKSSKTKTAKRRSKPLPEFKPIKKKLNRSALLAYMVKKMDLTTLLSECRSVGKHFKAEDGESEGISDRDAKKIVQAFFAAQQRAILGSIGPGGSGKFQIPGLLNIVTKHVPAKKGGEKRPNPFKKGEFVITKAKPATTKVKARPTRMLKDVAAS